MLTGGITKRDKICQLLKDISIFLNSDCMFSVTDTEKFIAYCPGKKIDIKVKIGEDVPLQSPLTVAVKTRKVITNIVPKEIWGIPFRATATPICDEKGNIVGCVGIGISIEKEAQLTETYNQFEILLNQITNQTNIIDIGMNQILEDNLKFINIMTKTTQTSQEILLLLGKVQAIAKTTDILAINASIEASRAGENGKGFSVIANKIKDLSEHTKEATNLIVNMINQISESVNELSGITLINNESINNQIKTLSEISDVIKNMQTASNKYSNLLK